MEEKNSKEIFNLFVYFISILIMLGGFAMVVSSFYTNISLFQSIVVTTAGAILFYMISLRIIILKTLNTLTKYLEKLNTEVSKSTPPNINDFDPIKVFYTDSRTIDLNKTTEKLTAKDIANDFETLFKYFQQEQIQPLSLELMSIEQLNKELNKCVGNNEFEKAASIRDEINKRKDS
jgi:hypothetical protein